MEEDDFNVFGQDDKDEPLFLDTDDRFDLTELRNSQESGADSPRPTFSEYLHDRAGSPFGARKRKLGEDPLDYYLVERLPRNSERELKKERQDFNSLENLVSRIESAKRAKFAASDEKENGESEGGGAETEAPRNQGKLFKVPPANAGNWVPISAPNKEARFYVISNRTDEQQQDLDDKNLRQKKKKVGLLGEPFETILRKAEQIREERASFLKLAGSEMDLEVPATLEAVSCVPATQLWVEKYKPRLFTDLLSDDGVNRTLLTWLKLWDECVFGRRSVSAGKGDDQPPKQQKKKSRFAADPDELPRDLDKHKRPTHKVALLCGAPGLGKTTLAHVILRQAGYHAVEVNASDERSVEAFGEAIEKATRFQRTLDADPRPNCLLLDEIDGAPQPSVNYLVSLVTGADTKKKKQQILRRPIICICNDLYASSLRELRKVALVVQFPETSNQRLADRLSLICKRERLKTEQATLESLCERTCRDIRACLNTIQFAAGETLQASALDVQSIGTKDQKKSLFDLWRLVFQLPAKSSTKRWEMVYGAVCGCGETERLREGLFDNYLLANVRDSRLETACCASGWLTFGDVFESNLRRTGNWSLFPYVAFLPVAFHCFYAAPYFFKITFPFSPYQMQQKRQVCEGVLEAVMAGAKPSVRQRLTGHNLTKDILPYLSLIIQPTLRPVNAQLYSSKEREEVGEVVGAMLSYGLSYRQERSPDGLYPFVLEPALDKVAAFGSTQLMQLTNSSRQLISREIELEKFRRVERKLKKWTGKSNVKPNLKPSSETKTVCQPLGGGRVVVERKRRPGLWFKFREGYSNAVRRNIRMRDLL